MSQFHNRGDQQPAWLLALTMLHLLRASKQNYYWDLLDARVIANSTGLL